MAGYRGKELNIFARDHILPNLTRWWLAETLDTVPDGHVNRYARECIIFTIPENSSEDEAIRYAEEYIKRHMADIVERYNGGTLREMRMEMATGECNIVIRFLTSDE